MAPSRPAAAPLPPVAISEYDGVRSLHLGSIWIQGSMRIAQPDRIELEYVQRMLAALLWVDDEALRDGLAVHLGLGAATLTRFTHRVLRMPTLAVEINPAVIEACRRSFRLPHDGPMLQVQRSDAGAWVADAANAGCARLLLVDLYDHEAAAPVLDSDAFYAGCREVLRAGGVMSVNLFGRHASFAVSAARIAAVFGADQVWSLRPTREGNTVVVAGQGVVVPPRAELLQRAATIEQRWGDLGLKARGWLRMVRPWRPAAPPAPV